MLLSFVPTHEYQHIDMNIWRRAKASPLLSLAPHVSIKTTTGYVCVIHDVLTTGPDDVHVQLWSQQYYTTWP